MELLRMAERLVQGHADTEVMLVREGKVDVEVENGILGTASSSTVMGGGVRVVRDGRAGFAYFSSPEAFGSAVSRAESHARHAPKLDIQLPGAAAAPAVPNHFDAELAELDVESVLGWTRRLMDADLPRDARLSGGASVSAGEVALANSEGAAWFDQGTDASVGVSLVLPDGERAIQAWDDETVAIGSPDIEAVVGRVAADVSSLQQPQPTKSGTADVVIRRAAAAELMGLIGSFVHGDDAMRGKSPWAKSLGETVAATGLSVVDNPHLTALGAEAFDGDGLPTRVTNILSKGVLDTFIFNLEDGAEHKQASTAHAIRGGFMSAPGTGIHHMVVDAPRADVVAGIDDGYLIGSILGAHTANSTTGDFSVNAPNVWRIKGGQVVGACQEIALGGNFPEWLTRLDGMATPKSTGGLTMGDVRFRDVAVSV